VRKFNIMKRILSVVTYSKMLRNVIPFLRNGASVDYHFIAPDITLGDDSSINDFYAHPSVELIPKRYKKLMVNRDGVLMYDLKHCKRAGVMGEVPSFERWLLGVYKSYRPDVVVVDNPNCRITHLFRRVCNKVIYIHHGFISDHGLTTIAPKASKFIDGWTSSNYFIGCGPTFTSFMCDIFHVNSSQVYAIPGIPQMDLLYSITRESSVKTIQSFVGNDRPNLLLVTCSTWGVKQFFKDLNAMMDAIGPFAEKYGWNVIIKPKNYELIKQIEGTDGVDKSLKKSLIGKLSKDYIHLLSNRHILYPFLQGSEIVCVQEGGSAFLEGLIVNPNTILSHVTSMDNWMRHMTYPDLLCPSNIAELSGCIETLRNKFEESDHSSGYLECREKYLHDMVGGAPGPVVDTIENIFIDICNNEELFDLNGNVVAVESDQEVVSPSLKAKKKSRRAVGKSMKNNVNINIPTGTQISFYYVDKLNSKMNRTIVRPVGRDVSTIFGHPIISCEGRKVDIELGNSINDKFTMNLINNKKSPCSISNIFIV
jgi:hypothetical protein